MSCGPCWASPSSQLSQRLEEWPEWRKPAQLPRPNNNDDLVYPTWFEGLWHIDNQDLDDIDAEQIQHQARFQPDGQGRMVGDRAFNALSIGKALLGEQLLRVEDDPNSANDQMAQLKGGLRLETRVISRDQSTPDNNTFLSDEIVLQILHRPGPPRLSQIETLSRYQRSSNQNINGEQWQAIYPPPGQSTSENAIKFHHFKLIMQREESEN